MSNKEIREYYERLSQERDKFAKQARAKGKHFWSAWYCWSAKEKLGEVILKRIKPADRVLAVGCGFGDDFTPLLKEDFLGVGVDFSFSQLKQGQANPELRSIKWIQAEVDDLPFPDARFDMVIFSEVIEHLQDCSKSLSEIHRVLKDNGRLFLTTPNRYDYFHFLGSLFPRKIRRWIKNFIQFKENIDLSEISPDLEEHTHLFSLRELIDVIKRSGFEAEESRSGRLRVPLSRLFDRYRLLQILWVRFDNFLSRLPFSIFIRANFILVLKKQKKGHIDESDPVNQLGSIFLLPKEEVVKQISNRFYNAFPSFFQDRFKFKRYVKAVELIFGFIQGRDKVILDAGCGFGLVSIIFSSLGVEKVFSIDFSQPEIDSFKKILSKLTPLENLVVKQMDCQKTEFPDNSFDIVFASDSISHLYDLEGFLKEIKRILKKKGTFYIYESNSSLNIGHQLRLHQYWKMVEYGPVDHKIGLDKPFCQIREEMILKYYPEIEPAKLEYLVKVTQGMCEEEIKSAVIKFLNSGTVEKKGGFKFVDPRCGMLAERSINPCRLKQTLSRCGFKTRILPPYFYYTYPFLSEPLKNNTWVDVVKTGIKKIIRYTYPLSLLTTPRFEILATNEKI